jgi:hypothetical protein
LLIKLKLNKIGINVKIKLLLLYLIKMVIIIMCSWFGWPLYIHMCVWFGLIHTGCDGYWRGANCVLGSFVWFFGSCLVFLENELYLILHIKQGNIMYDTLVYSYLNIYLYCMEITLILSGSKHVASSTNANKNECWHSSVYFVLLYFKMLCRVTPDIPFSSIELI